MEWTLAAIAATLLAYAAVSRALEGTPLTPAIFFTAAGLLIGADVLGIVDLQPSTAAVKILAEATLAVVLFADASRIDLGALRGEYRVPARLLGIGLPLTIAAGVGVALLVFTQLAWPEALVLAVALAPTDAALGQAVVTLPSLPSRVRQGLSVESGLNDGVCVPLFFTAVAVASAEAGLVGRSHAVVSLVEEIGYGVLLGVAAGALSAAVVVIAARRGLVARSWLQIVPTAGALLSYTAAAAVGGSGFIAAFVGGAVFGGLRRQVGGETGYLLEQLGDLLGAATFIVFGAALLEPALGDLSWAVGAYALLSLTLVRVVPVAIAMIGTHARPPTVGFIGWFGPRGLASIVFAILLVETEGQLPHERLLLTTIFVTIGLSVLLHGVTAAPLARRYAAWYAAHRQQDSLHVDATEVHEVRWRHR